MKKSIVLFVVLLAVTSTFALAQRSQGGGPAGPPPMGGLGAGPGAPGAMPEAQMATVLTKLLELTDAQQQSWQTLREQTRATIDPLALQARQLKDAVKTALEAGNADAATVGAKVISEFALDAQIKAAQDAEKTAFKALLTADQLARLTVFEQIQELMRPAPPTPPTT
jgi:Spy/CpxP family protein refolding chaperone